LTRSGDSAVQCRGTAHSPEDWWSQASSLGESALGLFTGSLQSRHPRRLHYPQIRSGKSLFAGKRQYLYIVILVTKRKVFSARWYLAAIIPPAIWPRLHSQGRCD